MTRKEFNMACKKNGFIQKKQCFYRCIGEGILQTIRLNESCYIDPFSPYYSNIHRRSARIVLGLFSIYDALPEIWFDPRFGAGLIDARNLVSDRGLYFQGLQDHIDIMEKTGFRMLDGILTHHRMVQALETMSTVNPSLITGQNIVIPYLICGETEKAMPIIEKNY